MLTERIEVTGMQLYPWQKECLSIWERNQYRGIVNVVTGAGKTVFALAAMDRLKQVYPGLRIKIIVPVIPLARQWKEVLLHHALSEEWRPGFFGGGVKDDPEKRVMIYIVNSARTSLADHIRRELSLGRHLLLVCDECHHYQSKENRKVFSFIHDMGEREDQYHCIGLSATPFGTSYDHILTQALGKEIYKYDFNSAASEGVISPFMVCEVSASFCPDEMEKYVELSDEVGMQLKKLLRERPNLKGLSEPAFIRAVTKLANEADMDHSEPAAAFLLAAFRRKEMSNLAFARIQCALSILENLRSADRILVFCERIEQAKLLTAHVRRRFGNICEIYHSELGKTARTRSMEAFRNRQARILVSCKCLDEGIDVPEANIAVVLSSTSVSRQRIQRLGRVIRRSDQKDAACLYYIYIRESTDDAAYLHGLEECETFSLRYFTSEGIFSNDLYEYAAACVLKRAKEAGMTCEEIAEIRQCALEGLVRADVLLPDVIQKKNEKTASRMHEKNYWNVMRRIGKEFRTGK